MSCVHPVAILRAVVCAICSLSMFVSDALGDHMVSLCLPHLVEVRTLSVLIVLRVLVAARSMYLL